MARLAWSTTTIHKHVLPFALCIIFYFCTARFLHYHQPDNRNVTLRKPMSSASLKIGGYSSNVFGAKTLHEVF